MDPTIHALVICTHFQGLSEPGCLHRCSHLINYRISHFALALSMSRVQIFLVTQSSQGSWDAATAHCTAAIQCASYTWHTYPSLHTSLMVPCCVVFFLFLSPCRCWHVVVNVDCLGRCLGWHSNYMSWGETMPGPHSKWTTLDKGYSLSPGVSWGEVPGWTLINTTEKGGGTVGSGSSVHDQSLGSDQHQLALPGIILVLFWRSLHLARIPC